MLRHYSLRKTMENTITKDCKESVQMTAFIPPDRVYITATVLSNKSEPQSGILITVENDNAVRYESAIK